MEKFLTINDLANYLNISKTTVYRIVESRKIVFYKLQGSLRFKVGDVEEYLAKNKIKTIE